MILFLRPQPFLLEFIRLAPHLAIFHKVNLSISKRGLEYENSSRARAHDIIRITTLQGDVNKEEDADIKKFDNSVLTF